MKKKLILSSEAIKERAKVIIDSLPPEHTHEMILRPYKVDRTEEQRRTYWRWLTLIGNDLGYTKDEMANEYKEKFLLPIYIREDVGNYEASVQAVKAVRGSGMVDQANTLKKQIIEGTTTNDANVKLMAEYLTDIKHHATSLDIRLPMPEDNRL